MNASFSTNRNVGIDLLKYLCAFLVICLHSDFHGKTYVDTIARIAVPFARRLSVSISKQIKNKEFLSFACIDSIRYLYLCRARFITAFQCL